MGTIEERATGATGGLEMGVAGAGGGHTSKDGRHMLPGVMEKRLRGNLSLSLSTCLGAVL